MSWQAYVIDRASNSGLWLTVQGRDLKTAEANAEAKAAFVFRADPNHLHIQHVHQLSEGGSRP